MGAWIEIEEITRRQSLPGVAPLVGAWIEIAVWDVLLTHDLSLPLWERGLKSLVVLRVIPLAASLPLWERGLKSFEDDQRYTLEGRSPCGSVD